ncbi:aminoglycoside phosphotransferase [Amycolatopsis sp. CA-230715]|uniref:aminoglycoside phosphotransferase n=1 Tax=Amycolatopsis sp. CA-230715 TaxID=2745196 RepID=UPI001C026E98|nr:aminoglycoside phosphotransferase [Amycolatopsis sp. CA-230715]QWF85640.1 hypothetical protein HUW46_09095 [Amycolatopsis sp. CA-230715]
MSTQPNELSDDAHRAWLRHCLTRAASTIDASLTGGVTWGWHDRSISSRVDTARGPRWLRVVTEAEQWADSDFWTGNVDARLLTGVVKPEVLRHWDWNIETHRLRAELMTLTEGRPCSATPELRQELDLPTAWWTGLRDSLDALATAPAVRTHLTQHEVTHRIRVFFGNRVDPTVRAWTVAHADLHWANLFEPDCVLVDWEGWGRAPAGYDAATLYLHSLLQPAMAERVQTTFADHLNSRDGLLSQLYATGRMLLRINSGDYDDLAIPLHHNADRVIAALQN